MRGLSFDELLGWILQEYERSRSIFGIYRSLFYVPRRDSPYASDLFGHHLATPIGPAAGPHTQLAQNIVCAWLSGGRFIELKTVQLMDELEIPRPCIDLEDEGYNVEWSQELKLEQSADEYVKAWVLIHVLRRLLGHEERAPWGTIFNMSVGYDLQGIQSPPMTRFMGRMRDASAAIDGYRSLLRDRYPQFADVEIPAQVVNSVTLSTMHGCPPGEIERIARYLMDDCGLHTVVKLNPTLLGRERVLRILHQDLDFTEIQIPDAVFEHDLRYERAVALIRDLQRVAEGQGLTFGVKLSNTLAVANHRGYLPGDEMYMSGRALYPITLNLFHRLAREFDGQLNVSYSAGADALNLVTVLAAGARPVTAASDLLKPGGYSRFLQYLENLESEMRARGAGSLDELARDRAGNLERAAAQALRDPRYTKAYNPYGPPKVESGLEAFDCIAAPCVAQCAVCQDVPEYAWWIAQGEDERALQVILSRNPLPGVTGYVCTHLCQTRCTRSAGNYDQPVAIRALKRFAVEAGGKAQSLVPDSQSPTPNPRVAVIGSGPAGLSVAYFLALSGVGVTIFEARDTLGGMLAIAPPFRLPQQVVQEDIARIVRLGVQIECGHQVNVTPEDLLEEGFDAVYVACGYQKDAWLEIEGLAGDGVYAALDLLERVSRGQKPELGRRVLVVGGGNTAMDAARTAQRLTGCPVTVVYRRTRAEMPAEAEEVEDLLAEGNVLEELASPVRVVREEERLVALECVRNELGQPDADGRRRPVAVEGSRFRIEADALILAIGQRPDVAFLDGSAVSLGDRAAIEVDPCTGQTAVGGVYAGGDVVRGPATIVEACADGRRAAEAICARLSTAFRPPPCPRPALSEDQILRVKRARARRTERHEPEILPVDRRAGFDLVDRTLSESAARDEAARCLQCSTLCEKCVEVCPNRANYAYQVSPVSLSLPRLRCEEGRLVTAGREPFRVAQARQILHVHDLCNECGNCATFCVHRGRPYEDKPRLFLRHGDYLAQQDNAFYIAGNTIQQREGGQDSRLMANGGILTFWNAWVQVRLSPALEVLDMELREPFEETLSLRGAAEMAMILRGVSDALPFLRTPLPGAQVA